MVPLSPSPLHCFWKWLLNLVSYVYYVKIPPSNFVSCLIFLIYILKKNFYPCGMCVPVIVCDCVDRHMTWWACGGQKTSLGVGSHLLPYLRQFLICLTIIIIYHFLCSVFCIKFDLLLDFLLFGLVFLVSLTL